MKEYRLPGKEISDLESFFTKFGEMVNGEGGYFGHDFESFDDCFFGGYGLQMPCRIVWEDSGASRNILDDKCLRNWCQERIDARDYLDEDGLAWLERTMEKASVTGGLSMFDVLLETMKSVEKRSGDGGNRVEVIIS